MALFSLIVLMYHYESTHTLAVLQQSRTELVDVDVSDVQYAKPSPTQ